MSSDDIAAAGSHNTCLGRLGNVDEIAKAMCFLVSDESSYITGSMIDVAGGFLSEL